MAFRADGGAATRRENVGHAFDLIAGARMALHADAQRAQRFDPAPDRRARHADFVRDLCAADHDHRVFGEQREQRVDAPVGGPRKAWRYWLVCAILSMASMLFAAGARPRTNWLFQLRQPFDDFLEFRLAFRQALFPAAERSPPDARLRNVSSASRFCFEAISLASRSFSLRRLATSAPMLMPWLTRIRRSNCAAERTNGPCRADRAAAGTQMIRDSVARRNTDLKISIQGVSTEGALSTRIVPELSA